MPSIKSKKYIVKPSDSREWIIIQSRTKARLAVDTELRIMDYHYDCQPKQIEINGEKIYYVDQKYISKSRALVEIKVLWKNVEVPVKLRMKKKHGTWKVYDLSVLGISAVGNYRAQFHWILLNKTPDQVIETIKEKIRNIEKDIRL